ncbi:MotE family protein [Bacillus sp. JJ1764]|uniref:MotE family protein n=1 Tax=Bacillus sp. JJ1764 TaxID=3122964 RepID=UPI002FFFA0F1
MEEKKKRGKIRTFFMFGIPLIVTAALALVVLNFLGYPVMKTVQTWGNKVPVLNTIFPDPKSNSSNDSAETDEWKQKYVQSKSQLAEKSQEISDLTKQLKANQNALEKMKQTNQDIQTELDKKQSNTNQAQMKKVASIYKTMTPSKAAAMFATMSLEDATITMSQLDTNLQSSILSSMKDAKKAAQITMLLKDMSGVNSEDPAIMKEQLHELVQSQQTPTETLAETISAMSPSQSAVIIQSMMSTNQQVALDLLKNVSTDSRSQILAAISQLDAKMAAQITASLN